MPFHRSPDLLLRALSALLSYPDPALRQALPEIGSEIARQRRLRRATRAALLALVDELVQTAPLEAEARYVDLFDRGRHTSLNLFEHVHGDDRRRGPAMLELRQRYLAAGMEPDSLELPDHLPLLLEYLSCRDRAEAQDMLQQTAHIVRQVGNVLLQRRSAYAGVMAALLELARAPGLDANAPPPPAEDMDAEWEEKPAFAGPDPRLSPRRRRAAPAIHMKD